MRYIVSILFLASISIMAGVSVQPLRFFDLRSIVKSSNLSVRDFAASDGSIYWLLSVTQGDTRINQIVVTDRTGKLERIVALPSPAVYLAISVTPDRLIWVARVAGTKGELVALNDQGVVQRTIVTPAAPVAVWARSNAEPAWLDGQSLHAGRTHEAIWLSPNISRPFVMTQMRSNLVVADQASVVRRK